MRRSSFISIGLATVLVVALPAAALGLTVGFEFERTYIDRAAGEVVTTGTYECDPGTTGDITAVVTQGRSSAGATVAMTCTGTEMTWEVRVPLGTPPFHPGPAVLDFGFAATDGTESIASGRSIDIFVEPQ